MITIIQQKDKHGWCYCLTQSDGETIDHAYSIGFSRPNYPLPAIPLAVEICCDEVTIWSDPIEIGPDLIEYRKAVAIWSIGRNYRAVDTIAYERWIDSGWCD